MRINHPMSHTHDYALTVFRITNIELPSHSWELAAVSEKWGSYRAIYDHIVQRSIATGVEPTLGFDPFLEPCSWYNYEEVMAYVSKLVPEYVLMVLAEDQQYGAAYEDAWHNGRVLSHTEWPY
jgi:hypothetical protein